MIFSKKDKTVYDKGFIDGETSKEGQLRREFTAEKEEMKIYYNDQIVNLNFEIKRLNFKIQRLEAENNKIKSDITTARQLNSLAIQKEREVQNWKDDFIALLRKEEQIRLEPLQLLLKMVDGIDNPKQIGETK